MLYQMLRPAPKPEPPPMHYLDSAELLHRLQAEGYSRADMARIAGVNVQQAAERLRLLGLDEGLQAYLRQEGVPERIALTLLTLPDPVTRRRMAHRRHRGNGTFLHPPLRLGILAPGLPARRRTDLGS